MYEYDILKELEKFDDDVEPGFLSEFQQQAPDELHSRIMNSIRQEALQAEKQNEVHEIKQRNRFNYRKYASFTAAAALLIFAFIGGAQSLLEKNLTPTNITSNTSTVLKQPSNQSKVAIKNGKTLFNHSTINQKTNIPYKTKSDFTKATEPRDKELAIDSNNNPKSIKNNAIKQKPETKKASRALANANDNDNANSDVTAQPKPHIASSKGETSGLVNNNGTATNNLPNEQTIAPDNNNPGTTVDSSGNSIASTDKLNPTNIDPKGLASGSMTAYLDSLINYEIDLNMGQISIIQFIKEKGFKISQSQDVYELNLTDFNSLNKLLDQNNISKNMTNEIDDKAQFIFVKMIIN